MATCPFKNILDPDIYVDGSHHAVFAEVREKSGSLAYIEDPITGVPYSAVTKREIAILSLCGIPMEDKQQFFDWTNTMIFTEDEDMSGEDGVAASQAAAIEVYAHAASLAQFAAKTRNAKSR